VAKNYLNGARNGRFLKKANFSDEFLRGSKPRLQISSGAGLNLGGKKNNPIFGGAEGATGVIRGGGGARIAGGKPIWSRGGIFGMNAG